MIPVDRKITAPKPVFTPAGFRKAYARYKAGDRRPLIAMMREAANDAVVRGCLTGRRAGVVRGFVVRPHDDTELHRRRADWLAWTIQKKLKARRFFKALQEARLYEYNVLDFDWEVIAGLQTPVRFRPLGQEYFRYEGERPYQTLAIDQGLTTLPIPDTALVAEERDESPVMLSVLDRYILLSFGWEVWSGWMEAWGEGLLIAERPQNWQKEQKDELNDDLRDLGAAGRGSVPAGTKLNHYGAPSGSPGHQNYKQEAVADISIAILGHADGASSSSGTQIGNNTTSLKVRDEIAVDDLGFIDDSLVDYTALLWARNYADGTEPEIETLKPRMIDVREHRETVRLGYEMGATINPEELTKLGLLVYPDQEPLRRELSTLPL